MSASSIKRTIVAISAAIVVSAATIGATVSPAQAGSIHFAEVTRG